MSRSARRRNTVMLHWGVECWAVASISTLDRALQPWWFYTTALLLEQLVEGGRRAGGQRICRAGCQSEGQVASTAMERAWGRGLLGTRQRQPATRPGPGARYAPPSQARTARVQSVVVLLARRHTRTHHDSAITKITCFAILLATTWSEAADAAAQSRTHCGCGVGDERGGRRANVLESWQPMRLGRG